MKIRTPGPVDAISNYNTCIAYQPLPKKGNSSTKPIQQSIFIDLFPICGRRVEVKEKANENASITDPFINAAPPELAIIY